MPDQGQCRSCGAPVIWAVHDRTRKLAPMEQDDAGQWTIVNGVYFKPARPPAPQHRYTNHYATCPNARAHREGRHEPATPLILDLEAVTP